VILLLDAGNTRIKWAAVHGAGLSEAGHEAYAEPGWRQRLIRAWEPLGRAERVVASCVAGETVRSELAALLAERWDLVPDWVAARGHGWGVSNAYARPERLGPDRWAALVAARALFEGPVCVVDCGSAVTLDVLDAQGRHLGGWILPGLDMMRRVLAERTGALGLGREPERGSQDEGGAELGTDTQTCIDRGTRAAVAATIERGLRAAASAAGATPTCVLTGGDAPTLQRLLAPGREPAPVLAPQLVLQGLARIADIDIGSHAGPRR